ncbi:MAG: hypothetical protein FK730_08080 [Asgard group archaeon]|nr:hypothetical protein [Asgard group archaeon]
MEAEATAYVVLKHFNIDLPSSCNYLAIWKANKERLKQCFEDISFCATEIIEAIYRIASNDSEEEVC